MYTLGVDVAKNKLDVGLLNPENDQRRAKTVPNTPEGFTELRDGLIRQKVPDLGQVHLILEATGVYHEPVALWFFAAGASVSVVNPAQTKAFGQGLAVRTKTDARDSHVLARYGALVQPALWQPPTPEIRELHALIARLDAVEADLRREQNRQEKAEVVPRPAPVTESLTQHIDFLKAEATRLQTALQDHIDRHPSLRQDRDLWLSIPAVGEKTAQRWVAVLRSRPFQSADQATAFLGLVPIECQSGSSLHRRPRLSKAGAPRIRAALYMAAVVATRYNPHIRTLYERLLARGKAKMAALGAAMRKLVQLAFGVLKHQQPYQADWTPAR
jgi:transposase